jgi:hypothetical protein
MAIPLKKRMRDFFLEVGRCNEGVPEGPEDPKALLKE